VSGYVALCLSLPGAVVTYLVTGSRTLLPPNARSSAPANSGRGMTMVPRLVIPVRRSCSVRPGGAAAFTTSGTLVPGGVSGTGVWCRHDLAVDRGAIPPLLTGMQSRSVRLGGRSRRAERGELIVPERRDHVPAGQIRLPVVRVFAARAERRPPVFRLGGGPACRTCGSAARPRSRRTT
jgi:hypothetical protein